MPTRPRPRWRSGEAIRGAYRLLVLLLAALELEVRLDFADLG